MRGERQGEAECILAAIGDLTGTPLRCVRETALAVAQKPTWAAVCKEGNGKLEDLYWQAVFYTCDVYDKTNKLAHLLVWTTSIGYDTKFCEGLDVNGEPPPKGRGAIVLKANVGNLGHIVAWEDGLAYDSNGNGVGQTLAALRDIYAFHGYHVYKISQF